MHNFACLAVPPRVYIQLKGEDRWTNAADANSKCVASGYKPEGINHFSIKELSNYERVADRNLVVGEELDNGNKTFTREAFGNVNVCQLNFGMAFLICEAEWMGKVYESERLPIMTLKCKHCVYTK